MELPLPKVVYDVEPGGGIVTSMKGVNALRKSNLDNYAQQLKNQYYASNIESEMANRNALTKGQTIANQYAPDQLRLANEHSQQVNQFYAPNIRSEMASRNALTQGTNIANQYEPEKLRLANEHAQQINQLYPDLTRAQIKNYEMGGKYGMGVDLKNAMGFKNQLKIDHPDWNENKLNEASNSYYEGSNALSNGEPLPPLGGQARDLLTKINKKNSTAAIQNQAANMDVLASDLNDIDISPVAKFTGLNGKAKVAQYMSDMTFGREVPQDFRDYLTFKNITSNFAMDSLRKGFGTSVVPGYVYATLGKAANPASTWWHDPKQVYNDWNQTKKWISDNAKKYTTKADKGATANVSSKNEDLSSMSDEQLGKLPMDNRNVTPQMARAELARRELARRESQSSSQGENTSPQSSKFKLFNPDKPIGIDPKSLERTPLDVGKDLAVGALRGGQNLAATMGEAGQAIGSLMEVSPILGPLMKLSQHLAKKMGLGIPEVNIREEMGLGKDRPVDFQKLIGSDRPDKMTQGIGQFGLGAAMGGASLPGQVAGNALWSATQAQPDQQNAMGYLPEGRPGAVIEGGVLGALPLGVMRAAGMGRNAINAMRPGKAASEFMSEYGGGKTQSENIKELSQRLKYGQKTAKEEALTPKREVMSEEGQTRLFPSQKKGNELTHKTAQIVSDIPEDMTPQNIKLWNKSLKEYYGNNDIDQLVQRAEDIFDHPGLSEKKITQLDEALLPEKPVKGDYLKIKNVDNHYSDLVQEAHDTYVKSPTFKNSSILRSRLFKRINELQKEKKRSGTLSDSKDIELKNLERNRSAIIKDQDNIIKTFKPENREKYGQFNKTWREDVRAYDDANTTLKNMKNGFLEQITPSRISKAFEYPELKPKVQKILKDMGPSGVDNIIYNEIGHLKDPKKIVDALTKMENQKGFGEYISPRIRKFKSDLERKLKIKNALYKGTLGTAVVGGAGYTGSKIKNAIT